MTSNQPTDLEIAHMMADAARQVILPYFRASGLEAENKLTSGFDPVTVADREAETAMRDILQRLRPDDAIWGEEFGQVAGTSGRTWVLDPIDGTRGFVSGTPTWGVLIALSDANGPFLGIVDQPYIGERFVGAPGVAEMTGPQGKMALATRTTERLDQAILYSTFPEVGTKADRAGFEAVLEQVLLTRYGMDCYAYALVAAGQIDLVIEAKLNAYDVQGPIAVVQAAGGIVTDWQGAPAHQGGRILAAANATIHARALEILQTY